MIIGVALRYYKTYQGRKYIPLSMGDRFCGLVGNNGVGKSSILEALDTFFNSRAWNVNKSSEKNKDRDIPEIMPIFLIEKSSIEQTDELFKQLSFLDYIARNFSSDSQGASKDFIRHRNELFKYCSNIQSCLIVPIGIQKGGQITLSFLSNYFEKAESVAEYNKIFGSDNEELNTESFNDTLKYFKEIIEYIYTKRNRH